MSRAAGRPFFKMSGSGNDFIFFDTRSDPPGALAEPDRIRALCARGTGIGADGVVFLGVRGGSRVAMRYYNSDGSLAALCGNASLCSARLAVELGMTSAQGFSIETDAGALAARVRDGEAEIDLQPVTKVAADAEIPLVSGESRMGFALAGVPHLVVLCDDLERVDVAGRGAALRSHASLPEGANANFVGRAGDRWGMRTFERGVEGETLACGTGAVAAAILLSVWNEASSPVALRTRSGRTLTVRLRALEAGWQPSLSGEARLVFEGRLGET